MSRLQEFTSTFLILTLTLITQAQEGNMRPSKVMLKRGQVVVLSLLTPLDSGHAKIGDDISWQMSRPLKIDTVVVLPAGWVIHGRVKKVKRAGKNCAIGEVLWEPSPIAMPGGEHIKLQRIDSYPYVPGGGVPERLPQDSVAKKIAHTTEFTGALTVVVMLSPLLIPMGIAMSEPCNGKAGHEESLPLGTERLAVVSRDVRVTLVP